ncbi:Vascular non-inflammatory molecule 2 precursor, putative [Perkinsus marinus ATCC 50983]|uniref:Vascular non-inflammatory molecule 2, putative n=1 Tax=Perkinsus marinus (strain ATCC 50983 / TXsc) TaxID=423536 RepID=C5KRX6_PERM5|nr:Vascular non-inflammatory molecule 2 precursor, putative [Perkinsus marinus ATCC 50983]EER12817.1 Vascular non-inflammatory molecule 2 precursor, putative [Perkinsus marinus ATCC 50983]|eukprot:XP_002781022.1 Vascular non-inflammatory molecule 2 precursor, putative [Perkinsus marinus ATCC 50983]
MLYLPLWLAIAAIAIADARPVVRAAAIQYASKAVITDPPPANLARDLIGLSKLVNNTAKTRPDIVVLPEASLWGWILGYYNGTDAGDRAARRAGTFIAHHGDIPINWSEPSCSWSKLDCLESSQCEDPLPYLSCLARLTNVTLVANILHRPTSDEQYNTEVAFGPDGAVLEYYHKWHLFGEAPALDQPVAKKLGVFALPQNPAVKVGLVVCYDLLFVSNLLEMVRRHGVSLIVFSTSWASAYPSYNVVMEQQAMARFLGVGMIAANNAAAYSNGGGLYDGTPEITAKYSLDEFDGGCDIAELKAGRHQLHAVSPNKAIECRATFTVTNQIGDGHHLSRVALVAFDQGWVFPRTPDGWNARGCALVSCHPGKAEPCKYSMRAVGPDFTIKTGLELHSVIHSSRCYHAPLAMVGYGTGGAQLLQTEEIDVSKGVTGASWMRIKRSLVELYSVVLYAIQENNDPIEDLLGHH